MGVNETKIKNDGKKLNNADRPAATREQAKDISKKFANKKLGDDKDNKIKSPINPPRGQRASGGTTT